MAELFSREFHVRWGDMDFNMHMRNTAYLDISADVRMMYFAENGFSMRRFEELRIGPVILKDEIEYFRELRLLEKVFVTLTLDRLNDDASRFRLRNEFFNQQGQQVARVTSFGGWLDLAARKLIQPPDELAVLVRRLKKTDSFKEY
jgi:acyl-CoA thioester hydrolase